MPLHKPLISNIKNFCYWILSVSLFPKFKCSEISPLKLKEHNVSVRRVPKTTGEKLWHLMMSRQKWVIGIVTDWLED